MRKNKPYNTAGEHVQIMDLRISEYYDVKVHSFREISADLSGNTVRFILKFYNEDGT